MLLNSFLPFEWIRLQILTALVLLARLLRAGAYQIVSPLTYILNLTIRTVLPLSHLSGRRLLFHLFLKTVGNQIAAIIDLYPSYPMNDF